MNIPARVGKAITGTSAAASILRPILNGLMPSGPTTVTVLFGPAAGARLTIEPRVEKFYWTGAHEAVVQEQLRKFLAPGDVFWDVGAHIGFFSVIASRMVGPDGHVHAFEPHRENRDRLWQSSRLNRMTNVTIHGEALADVAGISPLYASDSSLMWSLRKRSDDGTGESVACTTLDAVAARLGLPNMIKVDVEGAELSVLQGGRHLLETNSVRLVVEFIGRDNLEIAQACWPRYSFDRLDDKNWLMTPKVMTKEPQREAGQ